MVLPAKRNRRKASPDNDLDKFSTPIDPAMGAYVNAAHASSGQGVVTANTPRELFGNNVCRSPRRPAPDVRQSPKSTRRQSPKPKSPGRRSLLSSPRALNMQANFKSNETKFQEGYDSDGENWSFLDAVADEEDGNEEEEVGWTVPAGNNNVPTEEDALDPAPIELTDNQINKMKVAKLQIKLKIQKRTLAGTRQQLQEQLKAAVVAQAPVFRNL